MTACPLPGLARRRANDHYRSMSMTVELDAREQVVEERNARLADLLGKLQAGLAEADNDALDSLDKVATRLRYAFGRA